MYKTSFIFPHSFLSLCVSLAVVLGVVYIGLIAAVMSYATLTIEYSQSVRNDETAVAVLEAEYLEAVANIASADYTVMGYAKPTATFFVPARSVTALR